MTRFSRAKGDARPCRRCPILAVAAAFSTDNGRPNLLASNVVWLAARFQPVGWLDQGTTYKLANMRFRDWGAKRSKDGSIFPLAVVFDLARSDIHTWREKLSMRKPAPFVNLWLEEEVAQSLMTCLEVWCALNWHELPWYYTE